MFLFVAVLLCCSSKPEPEPKPEPKPEPEPEKNELALFFMERLAGSTTLYDDDTKIAIPDIAKERIVVWEAWKQANGEYDEEKLISTERLSLGKSGKWQLPAELEPDAVMPYYWGTKGDKPAAGYPLYLYLHGSGDKTSEWTGGLKMVLGFSDGPSLYCVPQIPNTGSWYRWYQKAKQFAWEKLLRLAYLSGDIDPNKVYFFGISEGGYGSQRLASFYADYLAGAGPMAGGEPLKNAPVENCRNTAFTLRTGANDTGFGRNTLTGYAKNAFDELAASNPGSFIHDVQLIPGAGHGIDYKLTTPWLREHTRNPYPKHITWENFEMDGLYRNGFYNLFVNRRSNNDESTRTYYDMIIDDNDISLTVQTVTYETTEIRGGIEMKFARTYTTASEGKVTIYLCEELVDLDREVTVTVNNKTAFQGVVEPRMEHLVNSCVAYFDPARLYPAAVEIDLNDLFSM